MSLPKTLKELNARIYDLQMQRRMILETCYDLGKLMIGRPETMTKFTQSQIEPIDAELAKLRAKRDKLLRRK